MASDNSDQKRWKDLFEKLDANKDGKIEVSELADALKKSQGISAYEADTEAMVCYCLLFNAFLSFKIGRLPG